MQRKGIGCAWPLSALLALIFVSPAWGFSPRSADSFGNMALVAGSEPRNRAMQNVAIYDSPVTALEKVSEWCGTPSPSNPCLIKIMPGIYDLGGGSLQMQPYLDIEGSGESTTLITSAHESTALDGVVNGADNAEIRFLTVKNTTTGPNGFAIANRSSNPRLTHLTAISTGIGQLRCGVYNAGASPVMTSLTVLAEGGYQSYAIQNIQGSKPVMTDVTARVQGCSTGYAIYNSASSPVMNTITATGTGSFEAGGVHNVAASAPVMNNMVISGSVAHFSYGMYNQNSSPTLRNATITASGHYSRGIESQDSILTMSEVNITATSGTVAYGMLNGKTSVTMSNVNVTGGNYGGGIDNSASSQVVADRCTFEGGVYNRDSSMAIGASKLIGSATVTGGTLTCIGCYKEGSIALGTDCH